MAPRVGEIKLQLSEEEEARLKECAVEPIHIPGSIQPHGALISIKADTFEILQVSVNSKQIFGIDPSELLGRSISLLFGEEWLKSSFLTEGERLANPYLAEIGGNSFDLIIHRSGELIILEFEQVSSWDTRLIPELNAAIRRISQTRDLETLRNCVVHEIRELLGFDRVVLYYFYPDGHGEVVAEDRALELEPYLHQHFPASDIPVQARNLYLKKASQQIVTSSYTPVPLIPALDPTTDEPLDLTLAELRSVSPHHLKYMQNMGTAATVSLPLVHEGALIGMITASSRKSRMVSYVRRRVCEILAQQVTLQLGALSQSELLERQLKYQLVRSELLRQIADTGDIASGLCSGELTLLDLIEADGATARIGGVSTSIGTTPSEEQKLELRRLISEAEEPMQISSNSLALEYPELAKLISPFAGIQLWPCGPRGDYLIWYRREVLQTVDWLGDQTPQNRDSPLSPRNSFSVWRQSVEGQSLPWLTEDTIQISELIRDLSGVRAQQAAAADLERAGEVQRALQPKDSAPALGFDVAGACLPTSTVGGDFYDWYSIEDGLAITLGDVMGKGVGAGMIAAAVRTSLRADRSNPSCSVAVNNASSMINADLADISSFATLFHARLNSDSGKFTFSDAGHGLSIIVRKEGGSVLLESENLPIGLALGDTISERSDELRPGDTLISFSDGVLDMYNGGLDAVEFVTELARRSATPQRLVDAIVSEAIKLTMPDDITILAVKRKDDRP